MVITIDTLVRFSISGLKKLFDRCLSNTLGHAKLLMQTSHILPSKKGKVPLNLKIFSRESETSEQVGLNSKHYSEHQHTKNILIMSKFIYLFIYLIIYLFFHKSYLHQNK